MNTQAVREMMNVSIGHASAGFHVSESRLYHASISGNRARARDQSIGNVKQAMRAAVRVPAALKMTFLLGR